MPEDPNQGNNPEDQRPEWLPERFKSPEELARSYQEAEKKIQEQGTQLNAMNENFATLSEQLEELQSLQVQQQQPQQQTPWDEMWENNPLQTTALLTQNIVQAELGKFAQTFQQQNQPVQENQNQLIAFMAENTIKGKYEDYPDYVDQIKDELETNPALAQDWSNPVSAAAAIDTAYTIVKGRALLSGEVTPTTQQDARAMKLAAQTISGAQGGRPDPIEDDKASWERIKAAGGSNYADLMRPRS